ncbi:MAG: hypothetical protein A2068_01850 [Ignavibacteria bacterium GWB2_35_6b]|nr:MAG: hypothetical protein A2068_01850 [Ignavibacteria bacterium GWB2_35_6b]
MISAISNITNASAGTININAGSAVSNLPQVNSTALLNVIEKMNSTYKVLINGKVFQTQLPINAEKGDDILARVIQQNPFTLALDKFENLLSDPNAVLSLLEKLQLSKTVLSEKILKLVALNRKAITKSKLEKIINYIEKSGVEFDESRLVLLINLIWDNSNETYQDITNSYHKIFDISFEKLSAEIYESLLRLNRLNLPQEIYFKINEAMIFDYENEAHQFNLVSVGDKSDEFLSLARVIEGEVERNVIGASALYELEHMQGLLVKYILQKAIYNKYNIYPEFVIIKFKSRLELINYQFEKSANGKDDSYKLFINPDKDRFENTVIHAVMNTSRIYGLINSTASNFSKIEDYLCKLNARIAEEINIDSYLTVTVDETKEMMFDSFSRARSLNRLA